MHLTLLAKRFIVAFLIFALPSMAIAQQKTITGKVTSEKDGSPVSGASVVSKSGKSGVQTGSDGTFSISVPANASKLVISSVGYQPQEAAINGETVNVVLKVSNESLTEVVVIGYGTARKKDITGSVGSVSAKDFNKGISPAPDQLIQGKLAGVQVVNNSGAPGSGTTIRIRGASSIRAGNTPLFVIDGVPLSNTNSRPDVAFTGDIDGSSAPGNPMNFINPSDIASIDVLKDASAAAIYGSRGANGVVLITTKKGQAGGVKVDLNISVGVSSILKKLKVLSGDEYRAALGKFGFPTTVYTTAVPTANFGASTNALDAILRKGFSQNYGIGISSGTENARYRLSFGYLDQDGIIKKTDYKKYSASLASSFKLLNNKKLGLDFNVTTSQTVEHIAPISNRAGFRGSLIGQALQWNPTKSLYKNGDSLLIEYGSDNINPLAYSEAYNDLAKVTTVLVSAAPSYKITKDLEFKSQMSINYSSGIRKQYTTAYINLNDLAINAAGKGGEASVAQNELITKTISNTLSYIKDVSDNLAINAVVGHEYIKTDFGGNSDYGRTIQATNKPYYYYLSSSEPSTRRTNGFQNPTEELQSFFARGIFSIKGKYVITATGRADGSSKFGSANRYGFFPSIAAAWNISNENFMKSMKQISNLKLRLSYGITGNQEFPAGAAELIYVLSGNPGTFGQAQVPNENLKWEETKTFNAGLDVGILKGRVNLSVDYFSKLTDKILFPLGSSDPVGPNSPIKWVNLPDAEILNSGLEFAINADIIRKKDFSLGINLNMTFLKNELKGYKGETPTGEVNGQGLSGAYAQLLKSGYPLNSFYLKKFIGVDKGTGISVYEGGEQKFFLGSANPKQLIGFTINAAYKKLALEISMNGAFGHYIYNNTANAVLSFNNLGKRNVGSDVYADAVAVGEKPVNPTSASSRYLEKGNYIKMSNATLSYNIGAIGKNVRSASVFITGQNLFVITKFTGFDPEVNVSKPLNNVTSYGMEYTPYPSSRTINFGLNFSF